MKFVADAQLPPRLATFLASKGHDAVHVASLPGDVLTPDAEIAAFADETGRVVVTKDPTSATVIRSPARRRGCLS